jgi:hypothetical protein
MQIKPIHAKTEIVNHVSHTHIHTQTPWLLSVVLTVRYMRKGLSHFNLDSVFKSIKVLMTNYLH